MSSPYIKQTAADLPKDTDFDTADLRAKFDALVKVSQANPWDIYAQTQVVNKPRERILETSSDERKKYPMARGLLDYFPDALAEVSKVSYLGNEKHNPGQPMHHARGKSTDHADCIMRHLSGRGKFDGEIRESAALAWRALALLQEELETEYKLPLPRGAKNE